MRVAYIENGLIIDIDVLFPGSARILATGEYVTPSGGLASAPVEIQEACGYFIIEENEAPLIVDNQRASYSINMVAGRPVQEWVIRAETAEEAIQRTRSDNNVTLRDVEDAVAYIAANEAFLTWFNGAAIQTLLNGTGPLTIAQLSEGLRQTAKQTAKLTKGINRMVRLIIGQAALDSVESS